MKLLIDRPAFRDALQRVEMAIDRKPTRPVLGGVLLEARNDRVILLASDLEITVRYSLDEVQVEEPGMVVLPGRELVDVVKDLESDTVRVATSDRQSGQVEIEGGEDRCVLVAMPADEFPTMPVLEGEPGVALDKHAFLQMVTSTRFAASRVSDGRFATQGVLFETEGGDVTLVGTDGRRLAHIRRHADTGGEKKQRVTLLPKVLDQILRFGQDEPGDELEVFFLGNQVGFRIGNLESFGRVLEGEFPNYDNVIPKDGKHVVRAHRESLSKKLRLASHLTQNVAAVVRIQLSPDSMEVSAEHEGRGRAAANLDVDYTGGGLTAAFNPNYLLEGLKAAHTEQVEIQMDDASRPAKFLLGDDFTYVVMPLSTFA